MKIWLINQYNMPPEYGHLNRHFNFGKYLKRMGHEPTVFVGSFLHNTKIQMIEDNSIIRKYENTDYPYYFIKTCDYSSSKLKRIFAMYEFYKNLLKAVKSFDKPDAILGSSAHPLAAVASIKLAKRFGCQSIVEVRDLWPESFVAYGIVSRKNPLLRLLYAGEKWIYKNADKLVFTMEGGKDYIIEQGWDSDQGGSIDINKVHHINNGVDLEVFNYNKEHYRFKDDDLDDNHTFKVIYAGSIRKVNKAVWTIIRTAKVIKSNYSDIKFIIYGDGTELEKLREYCTLNNLNNVILKGRVDKKFIPYILSKSDVNILNASVSNVIKYGGSQNKLFEYLASGKPIITGEVTKYSVVLQNECGIAQKMENEDDLAKVILEIKNMDAATKQQMEERVTKTSKKYDYQFLAHKLANIIEGRELDYEEKSSNTSTSHR